MLHLHPVPVYYIPSYNASLTSTAAPRPWTTVGIRTLSRKYPLRILCHTSPCYVQFLKDSEPLEPPLRKSDEVVVSEVPFGVGEARRADGTKQVNWEATHLSTVLTTSRTPALHTHLFNLRATLCPIWRLPDKWVSD